MNVLILAVDHEIQKVAALRTEEMKVAYRELLTRLVEQHGVQFICEEADPAHETVGKQLASALGLPLEWKNIDMLEDARKAAGILEEQINRVPEPRLGTVHTHLAEDGYYLDLKNGWYAYTPRVPSDAIRETYMFERAIEGAGSAESILVLCGNLHVDELAKRFREAGHNARTDGLSNYGWYDSR